MFIPNKYAETPIFLHRTIAALIIGNCLLGLVFQIIPNDYMRFVIDTHKSFGITILILVLIRVLWGMSYPAPQLSRNHARVEISGAKLGRTVLYFLMIALPLSGWMHDSASKDAAARPMILFWSIQWPHIPLIVNIDAVSKEYLHDLFRQIHTISSYVLYGVLALHISDE